MADTLSLDTLSTHQVLEPDHHELVLVVDDSPFMLDVMVDMLTGRKYEIKTATSVAEARIVLEQADIDVIVSDMRMPEATGVDLMRWVQAQSKHIPFILVSGYSDADLIIEALNLGARSFISKPFAGDALVRHVDDVLAGRRLDALRGRIVDHLEQANRTLEARVKERTRELQLVQAVTINALAQLAETRDPETGAHIERTRSYCKALALRLQKRADPTYPLDEESADLLFRTAPLHDIGKVGVPDSILLKPGKLTMEEFEAMKLHTLYGYNALHRAAAQLGSNSFLEYAATIAHQHHERWDGGGYPQKLAGTGIALSARLMSVADVYDALISKRCYKDPISHEKAAAIIVEGAGKQFDPVVVEAFVDIAAEFDTIAKENVD
jgi:putative two-component system response regulator